MELNITPETKICDVLEAYPWIRDELIAKDERFKMIDSPMGKFLAKRAKVKDVAEKFGVSPEEAIARFRGYALNREYNEK
mgnify:CR=1 FL=1